jgi:hypothetical protein
MVFLSPILQLRRYASLQSDKYEEKVSGTFVSSMRGIQIHLLDAAHGLLERMADI